MKFPDKGTTLSARIGQACLFASGLVLAVLQYLEPGMNPVYAPISFYARAQHGILLGLALGLMALGSLAISHAYRVAYPQKPGARGFVWLSICLVLAAVLRAHPYFPWEHRFSVQGTLHSIAGIAGFIVFAFTALKISRELDRRWLKLLMAGFWALAIITCLTTLIMLALGTKPQFIGLAERCILFVAMLWFFALFPLGRNSHSND